MLLEFCKYQSAGNDFILVHEKGFDFPDRDQELIRRLCDRRFGIGADGLILVRTDPQFDFRMIFYNSDGLESSMCGNGGRCIAAFAKRSGIVTGSYMKYIAIDGEHIAEILNDGWVRLRMKDVLDIKTGPDHFLINTGSPHYVTFLPSVGTIDVFTMGQKVRFSERFRSEGINVDFVEEMQEKIFVRTYERGIENETLACGTGAVAAAICTSIKNKTRMGPCRFLVSSLGGELQVCFRKTKRQFEEVWLEGPVHFVYAGNVAI
jgi:diaminopimelate epimerase